MLVYGVLLAIAGNVLAIFVEALLRERFPDIGDDRACALYGVW